MHITGKEKTLAARPVQEVLAVSLSLSREGMRLAGADFIAIFP
jgi:hypothetical protein